MSDQWFKSAKNCFTLIPLSNLLLIWGRPTVTTPFQDVPFLCVFRSMKSWDMRSINVGFANGAEVGLKIAENFKETDMVTLLKNYADGNVMGGNILTSE